ncbi:MAG: efflux rane fusion protein [Mucilaginibacter sp.]|nr:efflux rane fusion protein [Mucilaginibacter sp.]
MITNMIMKNYNILKIFSLLLLLLSACQQSKEIRPRRRPVIDAVFGSGHLENREQYALVAGADGYLNKAYVAEGDTVSAGQRLYSLSNDVQQSEIKNALTNLHYAQSNAAPDAPQPDQLNIQIAQAQDKFRVDSLNYNRFKRLATTQAVSQMDLENAQVQFQSSSANLNVLKKNLANLQQSLNLNIKNSHAQYIIQQQTNGYYQLTSKAPGVVFGVMKKPGDYLKKGDVIAQLGAGEMIIKLSIAEDDISRIKIGQLAYISFNSHNEQVLKARITKIYPAFDAAQQAFIVEARLTDNMGINQLNGTQLQANIIVEQKNNALVVPSYCVMNNNYVLLKNQAAKKSVQTGIRTLEWTEIISGLTENDVLQVPNQN